MLCLAIVVFSNSGGPLACTLIAVIGCLMWRWRTGMSTVRWSMVTALVVLGIAMQAPLWYLPAKMSELTGGDGWHRSYLIEVAFRITLTSGGCSACQHRAQRTGFPTDWQAAKRTSSTTTLPSAFQAVCSLPRFFCALLVRVYSRLGRAMAVLRATADADPRAERCLWSLGVVLSVHVFNWFGLVYFDQYNVIFLLQLAAMSTTICNVRRISGRKLVAETPMGARRRR